MICAGVLPMPIVYILRRFQILKVDLDIHQGSIRRNETTASTKEMIDEDDVSLILCAFARYKKYTTLKNHCTTLTHIFMFFTQNKLVFIISKPFSSKGLIDNSLTTKGF